MMGRFGQLSLIQMATEDELFIVDVTAGGQKIVDPLVPLLESREMAKVFHDCREDAAVLLHQYQGGLATVFDTQVGFSLWLERQGLDTYQANLPEVMRAFLIGRYRSHRWDELENKPMIPARWEDRPLTPQALRYAVEGVAHLLDLRREMTASLGDTEGDLVTQRSARYVEYAHLNAAEFATPDLSWLRQGAPLSAMLASRKPGALYFKLNHSGLTGAVLNPEDMADFQDLAHGDVASCRVKELSDCRQFVHLRRDGHGQLFFDIKRQTMRRMPSQSEVDAVHPGARQSTLYGFGRQGSKSPPVMIERSNFKENRPEVTHKVGKRGAIKFRDVGIKAPERRQAQERKPSQGRR